ncbi:M14 family metallopeptidase [Antarcticibacterium sp. 1MA-6-2]|uniref:M14 family metallopeptidase n=1 Tax=Antarcticibacterium sp. 1MA-6-2 TaxID=2908210 RepID=UPI001F41E735|nr:M14 family metallopeptidase [Antarcticibacterium sp. 1MA-6-2]UJH91123.1 M14 family metallopeptidase [Antarcticibacterium sp. 1MA-6-2]
MKKIFATLLAVICLSSCDLSKYKLVKEYDFTTVFEASEGKETATYPEIISYYTRLAEAYPTIQLQEYGTTDSGEPLHLAIYSPGEDFVLDEIREDHSIIFINNGIHPGESDGIDATMMLFRDLAENKITTPKNTILVTIPVYNIGGALNRNSTSRTNQNGPLEYGFRGNARFYDLNRDFIKADTKNTRSFAEIFHQVKPDILVDTHVSNGADYQYTLTHLFTQHNKLGGELGEYLQKRMIPAFEESLWEHDWEITPYVNVFNEVPEKGFSQFMDNPRYSTGYAALFNTLGLMIETHMLKPYNERVEGTYQALISLIDVSERDWSTIKDLRARAQRKYLTERWYPVNFEIDSSKVSQLQFKGYEGEMVESEVTGKQRLRYNRDKPFEKSVDYYNNFTASENIEIPRAYIIPQAWWNVINVLQASKVEMQIFPRDTIVQVEVYNIDSYETQKNAYEGHYPHYNTQVSKSVQNVAFRKGDYYIKTFQPGVRYLIETLEPTTVDSFFNWNFFDTILQQKEGFSPYVFEDIANQLLQENEALKAEFERKKEKDRDFASDSYAQLEWLHKRSPNYENSHLRYPVFRVSR